MEFSFLLIGVASLPTSLSSTFGLSLHAWKSSKSTVDFARESTHHVLTVVSFHVVRPWDPYSITSRSDKRHFYCNIYTFTLNEHMRWNTKFWTFYMIHCFTTYIYFTENKLIVISFYYWILLIFKIKSYVYKQTYSCIMRWSTGLIMVFWSFFWFWSGSAWSRDLYVSLHWRKKKR